MRRFSICGWSLVAYTVSASAVFAQVDPNSPLVNSHAPHGQTTPAPLPFYDVRLDDGSPVESVRAAIAASQSPEARAARASEAARLQERIAGLRIEDHEFFGTPASVGSTLRLLTAPLARESFQPRDVAKSFVAEHAALFEIDVSELDHARMSRDFGTQHNGARHLTFQQQIGGVDLFGCSLKANVTRRGELVNLSSTMLPRPESDFAVPRVALRPIEAIRAAALDIGVAMTVDPMPIDAAQGPARKQTWTSTPDFRTDVPITTELVYFPLSRTEIHPAWSLVLPEKGIGNTYEMMIDATDGSVLRRANELRFFGGTEDITMRVYTSDSPAPGSPGNATPNGFQFPFVPRSLVTITGASVAAYSPNGWINDGVNETLGNNVDAHLDLNSDNNPDLPRPAGSPYRTFDFPLDTTMAPSTYRSAAVTQLFYLCNRYHDRLYALGFDEAAGNFQTDNFGLGGLGNDAVQADCQDGSGTNNANFGTPADGGAGRMQMFVFTGPTPDRDGDLDADIVYHEHTHGLSTRLHNLTLNGEQSGGMGEGWSDFVGLCLNSEAPDDPNAVYCTGGHTTLQFAPGFVDNYYFGIRRFPYCTDLNKNPQTFADIDPAQQSYPPAVPKSPAIGNQADEVHNVGEVWCNTLWEVRANLVTAYGYAGNELMLQLLVDGMKLSVDNPNFINARDAILQADLMNNGGVNLGYLWAGFAKRGMGNSATSPSGGSSTTGVVEAYDVPTLIVFDYPNGIPTQLLPGQPTTFQVVVSGLGSIQPVAGTGQLSYSINGGGFTTVAMSETSPNHYDATLPAGNCFDSYRFYVSTNTTAGVSTDPGNAPTSTRSATVYTGTIIAFADNFETNMGWTTSVAGATTGAWERGVPVNDPGWAYDPTSDSDGSGQCFLTMNSPGNTDVDNGSVTLTSPTIDMSSGSPTIDYDFYLTLTVADGVDRLLVEANDNNGVGAWTQIALHTTDGANTWRHNTIAGSTLVTLGVPPTATMKIRFTANDGGTQSIVEAGLDAFRVTSPTCSANLSAFCFGDGIDPLVTTPCPCANYGAAGHGCANSIDANGALLAASGTTNPDTIVLACSSMPTTVTSIYLQGDGLVAGGTLFGDGVRCAGGTLIRLGSKTNAGGASQYPQGGDLSVSTKGLVTPGSGATRYYQTYYRNSLASFCPTETFNVSNGVSITW